VAHDYAQTIFMIGRSMRHCWIFLVPALGLGAYAATNSDVTFAGPSGQQIHWARGASGVVGVAFTIGPSGAVTSFAITRSSGHKDLDAAARTMVQSAHFPPPHPGDPTHIATSFNFVRR
jgi:TonB family protein